MLMNPAYRIRAATLKDAAVIAHHRAAMFRDMGELSEPEMAALEAETLAYLTELIPTNKYFGWVIESVEGIIAGGGLIVRRLLPRPESPLGGAEACILNVYTEPAHRRRGLARELMQVMLEWCRENHIARVTLHASEEARALYESLGFVPTTEMRLEN
jgi:GNAT superfamily N-acetyltransferase